MLIDEGFVQLPTIAAASVSSPSADHCKFFFDSSNGNKLSQKDSSGTVTDLSALGSGSSSIVEVDSATLLAAIGAGTLTIGTVYYLKEPTYPEINGLYIATAVDTVATFLSSKYLDWGSAGQVFTRASADPFAWGWADLPDVKGNALMDFGYGARYATVVVPCPSISQASVVALQMNPRGMTDFPDELAASPNVLNHPEEHLIVPAALEVVNIVPSTEFKIRMRATRKGLLQGLWAIKWKVV